MRTHQDTPCIVFIATHNALAKRMPTEPQCEICPPEQAVSCTPLPSKHRAWLSSCIRASPWHAQCKCVTVKANARPCNHWHCVYRVGRHEGYTHNKPDCHCHNVMCLDALMHLQLSRAAHVEWGRQDTGLLFPPN